MPDPIIFPTTFNVELIVVALFNVVVPETFNDDNNVDELLTYKLVKLFLINILVDGVFKIINW